MVAGLMAEGIEVGRSLAEREMAETAREIRHRAQKAGCKIHLPVDVVVAREFKAGAESQTLDVHKCPPDAMILDAGPKTVAELEGVFAGAKTLIWNGPLGAFEIEPFNAATNAAPLAAARLTREGKLISVAGGGDTVWRVEPPLHIGFFTKSVMALVTGWIIGFLIKHHSINTSCS